MLFVVYFPPNFHNASETTLLAVFLMKDAALNFAANRENAVVEEVEGKWSCFKSINNALMTKLHNEKQKEQ